MTAVRGDGPAEAAGTGDCLAAGVGVEDPLALSTVFEGTAGRDSAAEVLVVESVGSAVLDAAAGEHLFARPVAVPAVPRAWWSDSLKRHASPPSAMSHDGHDADEGHGHDHEAEFATERETAPQSPYTTRDVGVGAAIAFVGMLVVFAVPLLLV